MTAAIELARQLSCMENGEDSCTCPSCKSFKYLTMSNVVIISNRDFSFRFQAACDAFLRLRNDFSRTYLIRTVRLLLLSYHPALAADKDSKLYEGARAANDVLIDLFREKPDMDKKTAGKRVKELQVAMKPLLAQDSKNLTNLSIASVRQLRQWVGSTMVGERARIIIIESIESANDAVRNSLLKMLEEPENGVYFILLSERPGQIIQTILSRVRKIFFPPLPIEVQHRLLQPFFLGQDMTIEQFFLQGATKGGLSQLDGQIKLFVSSLLPRARRLDAASLAELTGAFEQSRLDVYILSQLSEDISLALASGQMDTYHAHQMLQVLDRSFLVSTRFNVTKRNMWEAIYYDLSEV
jgi:DNA polymerase-3 subunit gamma/tau